MSVTKEIWSVHATAGVDLEDMGLNQEASHKMACDIIWYPCLMDKG